MVREIICSAKCRDKKWEESVITCLTRVPAKFNNYPHFLDNVLIRITEIKEDNKKVYAYLMRII